MTRKILFNNDFEIIKLLMGDDKTHYSVVNIEEDIEIKPQDLLNKNNILYFEYKNVNNIHEFKINSQEIIIKTNQNLFVYFNIVGEDIKIKIFYKPENINDLNLFIMGLKKIVKNNENK